MTASLWNHRKCCACSDPCICTKQQYSFLFSFKVLHEAVFLECAQFQEIFLKSKRQKPVHFWRYLLTKVIKGHMLYIRYYNIYSSLSSVLHKYAQNQVTLLVHISPTMFVPNFVHSYNLTHDCDMLIVVISDGRHKPITPHFLYK